MMTKNQPARDAANQGLTNIRALSSITRHQADIIVQAVSEVAPTWDARTFDDYDGYLSILIQPAIQGDNEKALSIVGTAQRLELLEAHGDDLTPVASFSDVDHLVARLIDIIGQQEL